MAEIGEPDPYWVAELNAQIDELRDLVTTATNKVHAVLARTRHPISAPRSDRARTRRLAPRPRTQTATSSRSGEAHPPRAQTRPPADRLPERT